MKDMDSRRQVFFLDGEPNVHRTATSILEELDEEVELTCLYMGKRCLETMQHGECDVLITELSLPDMDGCQLLTIARRIIPFLPVVTIATRMSVAHAVSAMKAGASDVLEKPLKAKQLLSAVEEALNPADGTPFECLAGAEKEVLVRILQGKRKEEIAHLLHRSIRAIEDYRISIMRKLVVHNLAELTKQATSMCFLKLP
jgi:two-component system response regulator FixJ